MIFTEHKAPNGVVYQTAPTIACRHAFTTRIGGVSTGAQAGLNLSVNRDPELAHVLENYRLLGEATGIDTGCMAVTKQVHGDVVRTVTQTDRHTLGTPGSALRQAPRRHRRGALRLAQLRRGHPGPRAGGHGRSGRIAGDHRRCHRPGHFPLLL